MELKIGNQYNVKVVKIIKVGAIVELEDGSTQLIHVSNISDEYVSNIEDFITIGHTYLATCKAGKSKPEELTLRPLNLKSTANQKDFNICDNEKIRYTSDDMNTTVSMNDDSYVDDMIEKMWFECVNSTKSKKANRYRQNQAYKHKKRRNF